MEKPTKTPKPQNPTIYIEDVLKSSRDVLGHEEGTQSQHLPEHHSEEEDQLDAHIQGEGRGELLLLVLHLALAVPLEGLVGNHSLGASLQGPDGQVDLLEVLPRQELPRVLEHGHPSFLVLLLSHL